MSRKPLHDPNLIRGTLVAQVNIYKPHDDPTANCEVLFFDHVERVLAYPNADLGLQDLHIYAHEYRDQSLDAQTSGRWSWWRVEYQRPSSVNLDNVQLMAAHLKRIDTHIKRFEQTYGYTKTLGQYILLVCQALDIERWVRAKKSPLLDDYDERMLPDIENELSYGLMGFYENAPSLSGVR